MRRIFFLTAARSELDIVAPVVEAARAIPSLRAELVVAGAHLSPHHGLEVRNIEASGLPIAGRVESLLASDSWEGRSLSFALLHQGLTRFLSRERPEVLYVAGDREEALAGALVATFLGIHIAHAHGGDRCIASDVDEVLRPAISKLAHFHFTATEGHRQRLIKMGEAPERVFAFGASGLDRLRSEPDESDETLRAELGIDPRAPFFLLIQHPTSTMSPERGGAEMRAILDGILSLGHPVFASYPNFDPGNLAIRAALDEARARHPNLRVHHNLPRRRFVALYHRCAAVVGNSSSIVIESAFLRVPGILLGPRQDLRETGANVMRTGTSADEVHAACRRALEDAAFRAEVARAPSLYGDGESAPRIAAKLAEVALDRELLLKTMVY
jgi:UDP-hydrolysing UDP-N-acetyl-D-glucosamine 2-epimerase